MKYIGISNARKLREAMTRLGSSEIIVMDILANRTNLQRQKIAEEYKTLYGMDLSIDLTFKLISNFKYLITAMMMPLPQYYAKELHDSMRGSAIDDRLIIEVLCTLSNDEIKMIKQA
ncbi:annexin B9-like isoform X2 [Neodiprion pinetum]|uniref:annexin B9-like isoform X2 n=1 Tax=Neodiprion pinetum TaxID=441929 RepID=UPI00371D79DB